MWWWWILFTVSITVNGNLFVDAKFCSLCWRQALEWRSCGGFDWRFSFSCQFKENHMSLLLTKTVLCFELWFQQYTLNTFKSCVEVKLESSLWPSSLFSLILNSYKPRLSWNHAQGGSRLLGGGQLSHKIDFFLYV